MKSRLALTLMIVLGLMLSTTGAGLALSGSSGQENASQQQYKSPSTNKGAGSTLGVQQSGGSNAGEQQGQQSTPSAPAAPQTGSAAQPSQQAQPSEQIAVAAEQGSSGRSLPFTGFVTIPLMLIGAALLATGAVMRWRGREPQ